MPKRSGGLSKASPSSMQARTSIGQLNLYWQVSDRSVYFLLFVSMLCLLGSGVWVFSFVARIHYAIPGNATDSEPVWAGRLDHRPGGFRHATWWHLTWS